MDGLIAPNLENKAVIDKSAKNVCFHSQLTGSLLKHATQNMLPYILVYVCMLCVFVLCAHLFDVCFENGNNASHCIKPVHQCLIHL